MIGFSCLRPIFYEQRRQDHKVGYSRKEYYTFPFENVHTQTAVAQQVGTQEDCNVQCHTSEPGVLLHDALRMPANKKHPCRQELVGTSSKMYHVQNDSP